MQSVVRGLTILAGVAVVGGCSAGAGGHAVCKDAASAQQYSLEWQDQLAEARHSNKLTIDAVIAAQGQAYQKLAMLKQGKFAEFCTHLDQIRAQSGF